MKKNNKNNNKNYSFFPLTYAFRSTSPARAFLLGAFVQAFVAALAIEVNDNLQKKTSTTYWTFKSLISDVEDSSIVKVAITFGSAFVAAIIVMNVMWLLFAYGGGMLSNSNPKRVISWI